VVALVTAPPDRAGEIAGTLVGEHLAACVNVVSGVSSTYRWRGDVQRATEALLVVKTTAALVEPIRARLADIHPDEVFELVALDVVSGNPAYLDWIRLSVRES